MNRRGFLQAILAAGMAPAIVSAANIMPVFARAESGLIVPESLTTITQEAMRVLEKHMRVMTGYDWSQDRTLARFDVCDGVTMLGVGTIIEGDNTLESNKKVAMSMLMENMRESGMQVSSLILLPAV